MTLDIDELGAQLRSGVGDRLREAREAMPSKDGRKMSLAAAARLMGVSESGLWKAETSGSVPSGEIIARCAQAYGRSADWLLFGVESHACESGYEGWREFLERFPDISEWERNALSTLRFQDWSPPPELYSHFLGILRIYGPAAPKEQHGDATDATGS